MFKLCTRLGLALNTWLCFSLPFLPERNSSSSLIWRLEFYYGIAQCSTFAFYKCSTSSGYWLTTIKCLLSIQTRYRLWFTAFCVVPQYEYSNAAQVILEQQNTGNKLYAATLYYKTCGTAVHAHVGQWTNWFKGITFECSYGAVYCPSPAFLLPSHACISNVHWLTALCHSYTQKNAVNTKICCHLFVIN